MKRWSLQKNAQLTVQQFVEKCFGDDLEFVTRFHNVRPCDCARVASAGQCGEERVILVDPVEHETEGTARIEDAQR